MATETPTEKALMEACQEFWSPITLTKIIDAARADERAKYAAVVRILKDALLEAESDGGACGALREAPEALRALGVIT